MDAKWFAHGKVLVFKFLHKGWTKVTVSGPDPTHRRLGSVTPAKNELTHQTSIFNFMLFGTRNERSHREVTVPIAVRGQLSLQNVKRLNRNRV